MLNNSLQALRPPYSGELLYSFNLKSEVGPGMPHQTMWGRLSSLPGPRTFQSGLGATGKSPQLADKNVCLKMAPFSISKLPQSWKPSENTGLPKRNKGRRDSCRLCKLLFHKGSAGGLPSRDKDRAILLRTVCSE